MNVLYPFHFDTFRNPNVPRILWPLHRFRLILVYFPMEEKEREKKKGREGGGRKESGKKFR